MPGPTPTGTQVRALGRYALYDAIAAGGMATVHLGRLLGAAGFSRTVAIKRLHAHYAQDPQFVMMFMDEAHVAGRIRHPNVVPTLDVVSAGDELFLVMEYIEGESLSRLHKITRKRGDHIPLPIACSIVAGMLHGLHAAHEARDEHGQPLGIVHRDVSPQNVLVGKDGIPRVVDFGVAKAAGRLQTTREGQLKGKLTYMAPELFRGAPPDPRVDVYAGAVVLWEVLAGKPLFASETDAEAVGKILANRVPRPSELREGVPRSLDDVVLRGLVGDPDRRFVTAREMALALEAAAPIAPPGTVGAWVEEGAAQVLAERAGKVARLERDSRSDRDRAGSMPDVEPITIIETMTEPVTSLAHTQEPKTSRASWRSARVVAVGVAAGIAAALAVLWLAPSRRDAEPATAASTAPPVASVASTASTAPPADVPSAPTASGAAPPLAPEVPDTASASAPSAAATRAPPRPAPRRAPVHFAKPD